MGVVRAISVSSFENDKTENNGNGLEDEDPGEVPNSIVDVSSINLRAGGPSGDSNKPNNKKLKTRKRKDTPQSVKAEFFALPFNVMSRVLEHLHPSELLRLARTSKKLRSQLMSKRLMNVWKKAREAVRPMIPGCPKDQSEPQWAELLFSRECFMCGTSQDTKLNLDLRLRGCEPCLETNLISAETARQAYLNVDNLGDVLKLIPYTSYLYDHIPSKLYGRISSTTRKGIPVRFDSRHLEKMVEIWTGYKLRIEYGIQGAYDEFIEFQKRRQIEVKEQLGSAEELKARTEEMEDQLIEERREAIVTRLVEFNHDPRDAQNAVAKGSSRHRSVFEVPAPLSDAAWESVELVMEPMVEEERPYGTGPEFERTQERKPILDERKRIAKSRYATFRRSYDASADNLLPDDSVFLNIPIIKEAIESDGDDVQPSMFDNAFDKLSDYLNQWRKERRVDLARMLIEAQHAPNSRVNKVKRDPTIAEKEGILLLATSVFACCTTGGGQHNRSLHWFETVGDHLNRYPHGPYQGSLKHRALKCVKATSQWSGDIRALVQAAGLNPDTATQRDMDEHDARFYCNNCLSQRWDVSLARSWRNCVLHLGYHGAQIKHKGYEPLMPEDRADIKARETAISAWNAIDWSQVAISSQGVAVNLQGSVVELKAPPSRPQAIASTLNAAASKSKAPPSKSNAVASKSKAVASKPNAAASKSNAVASRSNAFASKSPAAESQDMAVDSGLRCKLCPNSNREFATLVGLMAHAKVQHGAKDFRPEDVVLV